MIIKVLFLELRRRIPLAAPLNCFLSCLSRTVARDGKRLVNALTVFVPARSPKFGLVVVAYALDLNVRAHWRGDI
eukprot:488572-Amorphochlora_amoeboformis.AAC.2